MQRRSIRGTLKAGARRQLLVVQREGGLDQRRGPRSGLQVADHRFHGPERDLLGCASARLQELGQHTDLGRVADHRRGTVGLKQPDGVDAKAGIFVRSLHGHALAARIGRGHALALAIAGRTDAANHRIDAVAIALGVRESLQHEHSDAFAHHEPVGPRVEGDAVVRRERADLRELDVGRGVDHLIRPAGDRNVELTETQAIHGALQRGHRRGAGRVRREIRSTQIESVGDAAGDAVRELTGHRVFGDRRKIRLVALLRFSQHRRLGLVGERLERRRVVERLEHEREVAPSDRLLLVGPAHRVADDHRGAVAVELAPLVGVWKWLQACVEQRLGNRAHRELLNGVDRAQGLRRNAKASGVEGEVLISQESTDTRVALVRLASVLGPKELRVPAVSWHLADRDVIAQDVPPELVDVGRVGKDSPNADDRDGGGRMHGTCASSILSHVESLPLQLPARGSKRKPPGRLLFRPRLHKERRVVPTVRTSSPRSHSGVLSGDQLREEPHPVAKATVGTLRHPMRCSLRAPLRTITAALAASAARSERSACRLFISCCMISLAFRPR